MKVMISKLPDNPWWGHGTPMYENNPAIKEGNVPNRLSGGAVHFATNEL